MQLKYKKISYLFFFSYFSFILPRLGTPFFYLVDNQYQVYQSCVYLLVAGFFFYRELLNQLRLINKKRLFCLIIVYLIGEGMIYLGLNSTLNHSLSKICLDEWIPSFSRAFEVLIFAPIIEELVYRYCLIPPKKGFLKYLMIVISSFVFAYMHAEVNGIDGQLILLLPYFSAGILYGVLYGYYQNIWYSISAHFTWNLMVILLTYLH